MDLSNTASKNAQWFEKILWPFFVKLKCTVTMQLINSTPRYLLKRNKKLILTQKPVSHMQMFIVAICIISKKWKQSKCPSTGECIKEVYTHKMK